MNDNSLKNKTKEVKRILVEEIRIHPDVMVSELIRMGVIVPINANPDWVAQRLSEEITTKISGN